jgi:hypothetical protein
MAPPASTPARTPGSRARNCAWIVCASPSEATTTMLTIAMMNLPDALPMVGSVL